MERNLEGKPLKNAPLVEALFEIKWRLQSPGPPGLQIDPYYSLLPGRLSDKLIDDYPFHEPLPTASMPAEMMAGIVQHRFRKGKDQWPLVQIGPGIFAVNDTQSYKWKDFKKRIINGVNTLYDIYPVQDNLVINSTALRYINALDFDFQKENAVDFLKEQLKINIALPPSLFEKTNVEKSPKDFEIRFAFSCSSPEAEINLRLGKGINRGKTALIWELVVITTSDEISEFRSKLEEWLEDAHELAETWFLNLVEGDLLRRLE